MNERILKYFIYSERVNDQQKEKKLLEVYIKDKSGTVIVQVESVHRKSKCIVNLSFYLDT